MILLDFGYQVQVDHHKSDKTEELPELPIEVKQDLQRTLARILSFFEKLRVM